MHATCVYAPCICAPCTIPRHACHVQSATRYVRHVYAWPTTQYVCHVLIVRQIDTRTPSRATEDSELLSGTNISHTCVFSDYRSFVCYGSFVWNHPSALQQACCASTTDVPPRIGAVIFSCFECSQRCSEVRLQRPAYPNLSTAEVTLARCSVSVAVAHADGLMFGTIRRIEGKKGTVGPFQVWLGAPIPTFFSKFTSFKGQGILEPRPTARVTRIGEEL